MCVKVCGCVSVNGNESLCGCANERESVCQSVRISVSVHMHESEGMCKCF